MFCSATKPVFAAKAEVFARIQPFCGDTQIETLRDLSVFPVAHDEPTHSAE
jgi:hypothetical protein